MNILRYIIILVLLVTDIAVAAEITTTVESLAGKTDTTTRLLPKMRAEVISKDKYNINIENILPHLKNIVVFSDAEQFRALPFISEYIEDNLMGGSGSQCLAKGVEKFPNNIYTIVRKKNSYKHPETGENLGTEFVAIGMAKVAERGRDITKMEIVNSNCAIEKGDKLIPRVDLNLPAVIKGKVPCEPMQGYILDVEDGFWDVGKYHNVIISLGSRDGIEQGNVLNILRMNYKKDFFAEQRHKKSRKHKKTNEEFAATKYGELLVYKVFNKLSLGVVIEAKYPITVLDVVKSEEYAS